MIIDVRPEFGYELACSIPYAYWLKKQGKLEKVVTCKDMKPFYYFCDEVEEKYEQRSVDNSNNGVEKLPNTWIHHNALAVTGKSYGDLNEEERVEVNGVLDYSEWEPPPFKDHYKDDTFNFGDKTIIVANKISMDHGKEPHAFFDIKCLYEIFNYLSEKNYTIIYKRPQMNEFTIDENEIHTIRNQYTISADVDGIGLVTDYELTKYYDNIILLDDIVNKHSEYTYNEVQLKTFANVDNFISIAGGNSTLCSLFGGQQVTYVTTSNELRPGYFEGNSFTKKLAGAKIYPIIDPESEIVKRGYNDYEPFINKIKETF